MLIRYIATVLIPADGEMPIDMFRRDECYPITSELRSTSPSDRVIKVARVVQSGRFNEQPDGLFPFTYRRWRSFGCPVLKVEKQSHYDKQDIPDSFRDGDGWLIWHDPMRVDTDGRIFTAEERR